MPSDQITPGITLVQLGMTLRFLPLSLPIPIHGISMEVSMKIP